MTETPTPVVLRFLADQLGWLAHRPEGVEAFEELRAAVTMYDDALEVPRLVYAGPCDICGRDMYAREGHREVECRPCALIYPLQERREWLLTVAEDRLASAVDIARGLSDLGEVVNDDTIRKWSQRERLLVRGTDIKGRPLYRVGDVRALARQAIAKREGTA